MKHIKELYLLAAVICALIALSGCGGKQADIENITEEEVEDMLVETYGSEEIYGAGDESDDEGEEVPAGAFLPIEELENYDSGYFILDGDRFAEANDPYEHQEQFEGDEGTTTTFLLDHDGAEFESADNPFSTVSQAQQLIARKVDLNYPYYWVRIDVYDKGITAPAVLEHREEDGKWYLGSAVGFLDVHEYQLETIGGMTPEEYGNLTEIRANGNDTRYLIAGLPENSDVVIGYYGNDGRDYHEATLKANQRAYATDWYAFDKVLFYPSSTIERAPEFFETVEYYDATPEQTHDGYFIIPKPDGPDGLYALLTKIMGAESLAIVHIEH
ncbi:MAG: hypothetical protein LBR44_04415 [Clostridiales Family XIII bacterium]|jgi:hypothetical protein|nr:hypothetical protein [Clostridiales Family XIII bacterium]